MLVLWSSASHAADWVVEPSGAGDFTTIQAAITAAADGDTITVLPGTYAEALDFLGKDVEVRGTDATTVILDPGGAATTAVIMGNGEGPGAVLADLTIRRTATARTPHRAEATTATTSIPP